MIAAISGRLTDEHPNVRRAALCALGQVAEKGDKGVIETIWALLADERWLDHTDRIAVVEALFQVAPEGEEGFILLISGRLTDEGECVRMAALRAVSQWAALRAEIEFRTEAH